MIVWVGESIHHIALGNLLSIQKPKDIMAIEVKCDHCGVANTVDDKLVGKFIACTGCRSPFRVTAPNPSPDAEPEPAAHPEDAPDDDLDDADHLALKEESTSESDTVAPSLTWDVPDDDATIERPQMEQPALTPAPSLQPVVTTPPAPASVPQPDAPTPFQPLPVQTQPVQPIQPQPVQPGYYEQQTTTLARTGSLPPPRASGNGVWMLLSFGTLVLATVVGVAIYVAATNKDREDDDQIAEAVQNQISDAADDPSSDDTDDSDSPPAPTNPVESEPDIASAPVENDSDDNTDSNPEFANTSDPTTDDTQSPFREVGSDVPAVTDDTGNSEPTDDKTTDQRIPWEVPVDRRSKVVGKLFRSVIRFGPGEIGNVRFSKSDVAQAAIHLYDESVSKPRFVIRRIDLTNEEVLGEFQVAENSQLMDFSPDGKTILVKPAPGARDSLQVWICTPDGDSRAHTIQPRTSGARIPLAMSIDREHVVFYDSTANELQCWTVPQLEQVYAIAWANREASYVSWNRNYIIW